MCQRPLIAHGNRILDRLPQEEYQRLMTPAEVLTLPPGREIFRQDGPLEYVYFPLQSVFSVVVLMEEGKALEAASVGNEGLVGLPVFLGLEVSPFLSVSQIAGEAIRIPADEFMKCVKPDGLLDRLVRRYTAYALRQATQNAGCNALHSVEERMCRWLLTLHDRAGKDLFPMTHEQLAEMLGVRRQTVTSAAGALQRSGILSYRRGMLQVHDRHELEQCTCECYRATKTLYDRIMSFDTPHVMAVN